MASLTHTRARGTTINGAAALGRKMRTLHHATASAFDVLLEPYDCSTHASDALCTTPRSPLTVTYVHVVYIHGSAETVRRIERSGRQAPRAALARTVAVPGAPTIELAQEPRHSEHAPGDPMRKKISTTIYVTPEQS